MEIIYQENENECGPCIVGMLANEINDLCLERSDIIEHTILSNVGMNLFDLEELGLKFGLQIESYECEFNELNSLNSNWHIALFRVGTNFHYVIFKKKKNIFLIFDSSKGKYELSYSEFQQKFANIICTVEQTKFDPNKLIKKNKINLFGFISWQSLIFVLIFEFFAIGFGLIIAQTFKVLIGGTVEYGTSFNLLVIIFPFLLIKLLELLLNFAINLIQAHNQKNIYKNIWNYLFKCLHKHSFDFYAQKPYGTLFELDGHILNVINFCLIKITKLVTSLIISIITFCVLALTDTFFILITIVQIITSIIFIFIQFHLTKNNVHKIITNSQYHNDWLTKLTNSLSSESTFFDYKYIIKKLKNNILNKSKINHDVFIENQSIEKIFEFFKFVFFIIIVSIGINLNISNNKFEISELIYVMTIQSLLVANIDNLIQFGLSYTFFLSSYKKINGYLSIDINDQKIEISKKIQQIEFQNINFKDGQKVIFNNWNCKLENLSVLVGKNGSGKSSLFKSITSRFQLKIGDIRINNEPLEEIDKNWILKNVIYIDGNKSKNDAISTEKIFNFMQNYSINKEIEEILTEINFFETNPINYSTGQIQISRLILMQNEKNKIILLDEPLSAVNESIKEKIFLYLIKPLSEHNFVSFIDHNPNIIKMANKIIEVGKNEN